MRLRRLAPAAITATVLLALVAPAAASAHKHPSPGGRCRINLKVAPRQITAGDSVVAFGRLVCTRRVNAAGQTVKLFEHSFGTPGFTLVQSTTTSALGFYELTQTGVQTNSFFYVRSHGAQSGRRRVRVAAQVALGGPPEGTQLLTGAPNAVTFTGTVIPAEAGARVILQRQNALTGNEWRVPIVFFSRDVKHWAGYNGALRAIQMGFPRVYWYRGGIAAWKEAKQPLN